MNKDNGAEQLTPSSLSPGILHDPSLSVPSVTAIVVTYYTGPVLARSIASLKEQPEVAEIIIVDNGNWLDAVQKAANIDEPGPRIKIISGQGNIGFAAACNRGAQEATCPLLLFLNPDAVLPAGSVAGLLQSGSAKDHPWMMGAKLVGPDGIEQTGARRHTLTPWRALVEAARLYQFAPKHPYFRRFNMHNDPCPGEVCPVPVTSGACFLIPAEDYAFIDGMDENYFLHVEDIDFCLRFAEKGGTVYYNPDVEVLHFKGSSRTEKTTIEFHKTRGMQRYFRTHFSGVYPPLFIPFVNLALWARFGLFAVANSLLRGLSILGLRKRRGKPALTRARAMAESQAKRR